MEEKRTPERQQMLKHATIMFGWQLEFPACCAMFRNPARV
jgi:hypothetical protein